MIKKIELYFRMLTMLKYKNINHVKIKFINNRLHVCIVNPICYFNIL